MSTKLKLILGVLVVGAVFALGSVVFGFAQKITGADSAAIIGQTGVPSKPEEIDGDHDGLPDAKEAFAHTSPANPDTDSDGYLDGEEVLSGCDPIVPAPNDCPFSSSSNITVDLARIFVGALQSGATANSGMTLNDRSVDQLTLASLETFNERMTPEEGLGALSVANPTSEDLVDYEWQLGAALTDTFSKPRKELTGDISEGFKKFFKSNGKTNSKLKKLQKDFASSYEKLRALSAPKNLSAHHEQLVGSIYATSQSLKQLENKNDPFTLALAIKRFGEGIADVGDALDSISATIDQADTITAAPIGTKRSLILLVAEDDDTAQDTSPSPSPSSGSESDFPPIGTADSEDSNIDLNDGQPTDNVPVEVVRDRILEEKRKRDLKERSKAKKAVIKILGTYQETVTKGGSDGGPSFVTDYRDFARTYQDKGAQIARNIILGSFFNGADGNDETAAACPHLKYLGNVLGAGSPTEEATREIGKYRIDSDQSFDDEYRCTLPENVLVDGVEKPLTEVLGKIPLGDEDFMKLLDFNNNAGVVLLGGMDEIRKQRSREEQFHTSEADNGGGFLGLKNNEGQIKIPGRTIGDMNLQLIESPLRWLENVTQSGEVNADTTEKNKDGKDGENGDGTDGTSGDECGVPTFPEEVLNSFIQTFLKETDICEYTSWLNSILHITDSVPDIPVPPYIPYTGIPHWDAVINLFD